jgi:hypothetical protein
MSVIVGIEVEIVIIDIDIEGKNFMVCMFFT